jgi:hypothetical protein
VTSPKMLMAAGVLLMSMPAFAHSPHSRGAEAELCPIYYEPTAPQIDSPALFIDGLTRELAHCRSGNVIIFMMPVLNRVENAENTARIVAPLICDYRQHVAERLDRVLSAASSLLVVSCVYSGVRHILTPP